MTIFDYIRTLIDSPNPVIFEVGGCDGNETVIISGMFPGCAYVVLEPVPALASIIRGRPELKSSSVEIIQKAIGKEAGETTLYVSGGTGAVDGQHYYGSSSIKKPLHAEHVFRGMRFTEERCEVTTLDILWNERGCPIIDFIWSDCQAGEGDMIRGGMEALKHTRHMYLEAEQADYYEGDMRKEELLAMLPGWSVVKDFGCEMFLKNDLMG